MKTALKYLGASLLIITLALLGVVYFQEYQRSQGKDTIYLAVVGPINDIRGQVMVRGVEMYLDEINHTVNGKRVEIITFDDENNKDTAKLKAVEAAKDARNPLVVFGHRGSDQSLNAGQVYKEYGIPAITASAPSPSVTKDNEWYFRVIIENNLQGHFIARYAKDVLGYDTISVIYVDNDYGGTLGRAVLEQAKRLNMTVAYENGYEDVQPKEDRWLLLPGIVDEVLATPNPGLVILAVGDEDGARLVKAMRDRSVELPILEALITQTFYNDLKKLTNDNSAAYLKNVWTTQHLIYDTGNFIAREFRQKYTAKYGEEPDAVAAAYYDAAMVAIKAIEATGVDGTAPQQNRESIRAYLSGLTKLDPSMRGATGFIYFDNDRNAIKPVPIGVYDSGELISAPIQMKTIPNIEIVRDLQNQLSSGNILKLDNHYYFKTQVIYTGIDLNEISNLDVKNSTFTADFYIWFRYNGEFDESKIEFVNAESPVLLGTPVAADTFNGQTYHAYRVKANFKNNFNFKAYPFDEQKLNITIRNRDIPYEQLIFVRDELRSLEDTALKTQLNQSIVGGWEVIDVNVYSDVLRSASTLGNPRLNNTGVEYSTFHVDAVIKRDAVNFSIKNLFPIFAVLVLAYMAFFIPASEFGLRVSLGINAIMTTAFFSLKVSSDLPSIGYLVALEYIFFMTYTLALFVIVIAIMIYIANQRDNQILIRRLYWVGRILFPLIIASTGYSIATVIQSAAL